MPILGIDTSSTGGKIGAGAAIGGIALGGTGLVVGGAAIKKAVQKYRANRAVKNVVHQESEANIDASVVAQRQEATNSLQKLQNKLAEGGHDEHAANVQEMLDSGKINTQELSEAMRASEGDALGGLVNALGEIGKVGKISGVIDEGDAPTESACTFDQMVESLSVMTCPEKCTRPQLCNLIPSCHSQ